MEIIYFLMGIAMGRGWLLYGNFKRDMQKIFGK